jgi:hypothetical protein
MADSIERRNSGQEALAGNSPPASGFKRWLVIGALLALVVVGALSLYFRGRAPAGTKVDSSGQQGRGPQ